MTTTQELQRIIIENVERPEEKVEPEVETETETEDISFDDEEIEDDSEGVAIGDFRIKGGWVYFRHVKKEEIEFIKVCSMLTCEVESRDKDNKDWGKLVVFNDPSGRQKKYHLRMYTLSFKPAQVVSDLVHEGLRLGAESRSRSLLVHYLNRLRSARHVLSGSQPGWVEGNFLLPNESFGETQVLFSSEIKTHNFRQKGTMNEWRKHVAALCRGNSRLLFGASVGFAAPLLRQVNLEGGGFHICGKSSTGKSTTLQIASSIYGSAEEGNRERYLINWDTTKGSLELKAEQLNDCLFACDELGLVDANVLGETLYMLGNGTGKGRMTDSQKRAWRIMIFTSGEVSIAEHMATAGKEAKLGQEVRLLQITADAGKGMGMFENIHDFSSGAEFSNHIKKVTSKYYGEPLRNWLQYLVFNTEDSSQKAQIIIEKFKAEVSLLGNLVSIAPRAALRFGAVAAAGELATKVGLTGWNTGEAYEAAITCFKSWYEYMLTVDPTAKAVRRVCQYIIDHEAEFVDPSSSDEPTVGYRKRETFLIFPEVFRDHICNGIDYHDIAEKLEMAGFLLTSGQNRQQRNERVRGKLGYYYVVKDMIKAAA